MNTGHGSRGVRSDVIRTASTAIRIYTRAAMRLFGLAGGTEEAHPAALLAVHMQVPTWERRQVRSCIDNRKHAEPAHQQRRAGAAAIAIHLGTAVQ